MDYSGQNKTMLPGLKEMRYLPGGKILRMIRQILIIKQMIQDFRNMPAPSKRNWPAEKIATFKT